MKIALAQINPTIGDFEGNARLILNAAEQAKGLGAELCLLPEQCIPGYPAHDLLERPCFIDKNLEALDRVVNSAPDIGLVVGFAERSGSAWGKGLWNSAALIYGGRIQSVHRKSLLPTYDIFDERRYFDPAREVQVAEFKGVRLAITICEDIWNDPDFWSRRMYDRNPVEELVRSGAELIINIAASPFTIDKRHLRGEMLKAAAVHHHVPVLFANMVGGNDDLVFDGASLAFGDDGKIWARGAEFREDMVVVDIETGSGDIRPTAVDDDDAAIEALVLGTRDYAHKCGFKQGILGLSGGIDSALTAVIGARAFGADNFEAVLMPSRYSTTGSVDDAIQLARNLGIQYKTIPIDSIFDSYLSAFSSHFEGLHSGVTEENIQARIRGNILMALSNKFGHLVLSTGNKSELATGYCTLYGDMAGGLAVLSDVPKTMVYSLCEAVNRDGEIIPRAILDKPPSAELKPDQRDQDTLPPYNILDAVIEKHIIAKFDAQALAAEGFDPELVNHVLDMVNRNEYKRRQAPPGLKITSKAFGHGRRIPIAQRWRP